MRKRFVATTLGPDIRRYIRMGTIAASLIMVSSWGVGWLPQAQNSWFAGSTIPNPLRAWTAGVVICAAGLVLGGLWLVRCWLRLGQILQLPFTGVDTSGINETPDEHRVHDQKLRVLNRAIWCWTAPLILTFPIMSRDVFSYLAQGRLLHAGHDPYGDGISAVPGWFMTGADTLWAQSPSPYGPAFLLISRLVWFLTDGGPEWAILFFRLLFLAGMAMCMWAVPRLARRFGVRSDWAQWIVITNPLFGLYMIAGTHNDTLMLGLLLTGLYFLNPEFQRRRILWGFILLGGSIAIKPLTVLVLPFAGLLLVWQPGQRIGYRARVKVWAASLLIVGAVLTIFGAVTGLWFGWIQAMTTSGQAAFPYAPFGLLGLGIGWIVDAVLHTGIEPAAQVFYSLGTLIAAAITAWLALLPRPQHPVFLAGIALSAAVVVAPVFQPWYVLWVLPIFVIVGAWRAWCSVLLYLLVAVLIVAGVVDQLAVAQWIPILPLRIFTAALGVAGIATLVFVDRHTRDAFPRLTKA